MKAAVERNAGRPDRVQILGIGIDPVTMMEASARIERFIAEGVPRVVVTADASGIVAAQSDAQWRDILLGADLVTPDSAGIVWASRRVGSAIADRVSGVDLVDEICRLSAKKGHRLFFLGARPGVAEQAADRMRLHHPGANIVGTQHGYFSQDDENGIVEHIREAKPDVLFVAMGIPRQEKFIVAHLYEMAAKVSIGVGGSFDVLSGSVRRAPRLLRKLRLEWLWRLILNPRKWRKALSLPTFVWRVIISPKRPY